MTTINLLPWREKARRSQKYRFFAWCGGAVCLALLVNGIWSNVLQQRIDRQEQRNTMLQQEVEASQKITQNKKTFNDQKTAILKQMTTLQNVHNQRYRLVELLDVLPKLLPNEVFIDSIQMDKDVITLQGEAQTEVQVSEVIKRFQQQAGWHAIQLKEISTPEKSNRTAFQVTLGMQ
jgi:type IV pilus assembly protein PilN